jgi:hypothetical protein
MKSLWPPPPLLAGVVENGGDDYDQMFDVGHTMQQIRGNSERRGKNRVKAR